MYVYLSSICLIVYIQGSKSYPFEKVLYCNVGDAHASGQRPLTFVRQLLSACTNPSHMNIYPEDVVKRAKLILEHCAGNSIGECVQEEIEGEGWRERILGGRERKTERTTDRETDRQENKK